VPNLGNAKGAHIPKRLARLAWLLDNSIPIPGLRYRIGLDGILGLIPGVGDVLGTLLSSYIIADAARFGVSKSTLVRMVFNVAVESVVGVLPILGDVLDMTWKANHRNVALLQEYLADPERSTSVNRGAAFTIVAVLILLLLLIGAVGVLLLRLLWQAVTA
jgi:hypothetical protein